MEDWQSVFTITPMSQKINLVAGETYTGTITVLNPNDAKDNFSYKVSVAPYSVENETYNADLSTATMRSQMVDWIKIENSRGTLAPNERAQVNFTITVPETAPAGGQYAAIMVGSDTSRNESEGISIQNEYEMASIIYAKVMGDYIRKGSIEENDIPGFVTGLPMKMGTLVKNEGNVHETVKVDISIKSMIGNVQVYPRTGESGEVEEVVMPDTSYRVEREINDISPVGIYEVYQTVTYMGETSSVGKIVVACPVWLMAMILIIIVMIISGIVCAAKRRKRKRIMVENS